MAKKTTTTDVRVNKKLKSLVREYQTIKANQAMVERQLDRVKASIFKHLGISQAKKMSKKDAKAFEKVTVRLWDKVQSVISIFVQARPSANWEYISGKFSPREMRYAKRESRNVELRITQKD